MEQQKSPSRVALISELLALSQDFVDNLLARESSVPGSINIVDAIETDTVCAVVSVLASELRKQGSEVVVLDAWVREGTFLGFKPFEQLVDALHGQGTFQRECLGPQASFIENIDQNWLYLTPAAFDEAFEDPFWALNPIAVERELSRVGAKIIDLVFQRKSESRLHILCAAPRLSDVPCFNILNALFLESLRQTGHAAPVLWVVCDEADKYNQAHLNLLQQLWKVKSGRVRRLFVPCPSPGVVRRFFRERLACPEADVDRASLELFIVLKEKFGLSLETNPVFDAHVWFKAMDVLAENILGFKPGELPAEHFALHTQSKPVLSFPTAGELRQLLRYWNFAEIRQRLRKEAFSSTPSPLGVYLFLLSLCFLEPEENDAQILLKIPSGGWGHSCYVAVMALHLSGVAGGNVRFFDEFRENLREKGKPCGSWQFLWMATLLRAARLQTDPICLGTLKSEVFSLLTDLERKYPQRQELSLYWDAVELLVLPSETSVHKATDNAGTNELAEKFSRIYKSVSRENPNLFIYLAVGLLMSPQRSRLVVSASELMREHIRNHSRTLPASMWALPLRNLGMALTEEGHFSEAILCMQDALAVATHSNRQDVRCIIERDVATVSLSGGIITEDWRERIAASLALGKEHNLSAEVLETLQNAALFHFYDSSKEEFLRALNELHHYVEVQGGGVENREYPICLYEFLSAVSGSEGLAKVSESLWERMENFASMGADSFEGCWLACVLLLKKGSFGEVLAACHRVIEVYQNSSEHRVRRAGCLVWLADVLEKSLPENAALLPCDALSAHALAGVFRTMWEGLSLTQDRFRLAHSPLTQPFWAKESAFSAESKVKLIRLAAQSLLLCSGFSEISLCTGLAFLSVLGFEQISFGFRSASALEDHHGYCVKRSFVASGRCIPVCASALDWEYQGTLPAPKDTISWARSAAVWKVGMLPDRRLMLESRNGDCFLVLVHRSLDGMSIPHIFAHECFNEFFRTLDAVVAHARCDERLQDERNRTDLLATQRARSALELSELLEIEREKLRLANERLKEIDAARQAFFANISHELRTPLTLSIGLLEELQTTALRLNPKHMTLLRTGLRNQLQLLNMVDNLLDHAKIEANMLIPEKINFALERVVARVCEQFSVGAARLSLQFRTELSEAVALADPTHAEQILANLLSNAFKFCRTGDNICVRMIVQNGRPGFIVQDSGPGLEPERREALFKRFGKTRASSAMFQGGTGIGLSIVAELARLNNTEVFVASETGQGTTFTVLFPAGNAQPSEALESTPPVARWHGLVDSEERPLQIPFAPVHPDAAKGQLLVVEDSADIRALLHTLLSSEYDLYFAENGREGYARFCEKSGIIELVLSDYVMPVEDGLTLLQKIRRHPEGRIVPFVMLTARADEESKWECLKHGVSDFVTKPFSPQELTLRLHNLVDMGRLQKIALDSHALRSSAEIAKGIAHEVNNPLQILSLQVEELQEGLGMHHALVMKEVKRNLSRITDSIRKLSALRAFGSDEHSGIDLERVVKKILKQDE